MHEVFTGVGETHPSATGVARVCLTDGVAELHRLLNKPGSPRLIYPDALRELADREGFLGVREGSEESQEGGATRPLAVAARRSGAVAGPSPVPAKIWAARTVLMLMLTLTLMFVLVLAGASRFSGVLRRSRPQPTVPFALAAPAPWSSLATPAARPFRPAPAAWPSRPAPPAWSASSSEAAQGVDERICLFRGRRLARAGLGGVCGVHKENFTCLLT
ncbi:hypothetical protein SD72_13125 [Leucobacter komagatae]|uniref:Uncharacterized protein n=1 Tax=Leucobacter komagatae TaxID=55969 RepID=A0A0D0IQL2_9MICO|nr:hypothetical protein SD72_13125 [Leucobacter komagatae]